MASGTFVYRRGDAPRGKLEYLFPTPLLNQRLALASPDFLARVGDHIRALRDRDQGVKRSNVGGWHSTGDLFDTADETIRQLADALLSATAQITYTLTRELKAECSIEVTMPDAWANVSRNGDFNQPHIHPGTAWSGVFYVDPGERQADPPENGNIAFIDPRPGNHRGGKHMLRPRPGQILIFPSWLSHYVNPFRGKGERISIAFNANVRVSGIEGDGD